MPRIKSPSLDSPLWLYLLPALLYLALAVVFTYPLVLHATDHTATADGSGDEFQTIWFFWWMKKALLGLMNPYWTNDIYYPQGTGLAYHLSPSTNLFALGISTFTGAPINGALVFNLLIACSFVITGLASFLLIRQVSGHAFAAFLGSVFITVSPYRMFHLNHLNLLSLGWGILAVYFFLRLLDNPRRQFAVWSALCFVILFYASLSDALFVVLLLFAYMCVSARAIWQHPMRRDVIRRASLCLLLTGVLLAPGLYQLRQTGSSWNPRPADLRLYSADPTSFLIPLSPDGAPYLPSILQKTIGWNPSWVSESASQAFLGWGLLFAVIVTIVTMRRRAAWKWLCLAIMFLVLSLGPTLRVGEQILLNERLPYHWILEGVPFLGLSRTPIRFVVLGHLCLVVFASYGMATWCRRISSRLRSRTNRAATATAAVIVVCALVYLEGRPVQVELWPVFAHDLYHVMAADSEIKAVLELPIADPNHLHNRYMYWQTIHGHKVVNGYLTHPTPGADSLIAQMRKWNEIGPQEREFLRTRGINAVVMHAAEEAGQEAKLYRLE